VPKVVFIIGLTTGLLLSLSVRFGCELGWLLGPNFHYDIGWIGLHGSKKSDQRTTLHALSSQTTMGHQISWVSAWLGTRFFSNFSNSGRKRNEIRHKGIL